MVSTFGAQWVIASSARSMRSRTMDGKRKEMNGKRKAIGTRRAGRGEEVRAGGTVLTGKVAAWDSHSWVGRGLVGTAARD